MENPTEKGITSISVEHSRIVGFSRKDVEFVVAISSKILDHISELIRLEKEKILSIVRRQDIIELMKNGKQSTLIVAHHPYMNPQVLNLKTL